MLLLTSFFVILIVQLPITLARFVNDELDKLPDESRISSPELIPPQIDLKLFKSHDSEYKKYRSNIEYIIVHDDMELNGNIEENKVDIDTKKNIKGKDKSFNSRRIINNICPQNQRLDFLGRCKEII